MEDARKIVHIIHILCLSSIQTADVFHYDRILRIHTDSTTTVYIYIYTFCGYLLILQAVCVFDGENFWTDIKFCFLVSELIRLSI